MEQRDFRQEVDHVVSSSFDDLEQDGPEASFIQGCELTISPALDLRAARFVVDEGQLAKTLARFHHSDLDERQIGGLHCHEVFQLFGLWFATELWTSLYS